MTISPKIHKFYAAITGGATIVAGICLMMGCIGIWGAGDAPFTPASVEAAFTPISIPVYLCLILVLGGLVLDFLSPMAPEKLRSPKTAMVTLQLQKQRADLNLCGPVLLRDILKLEKKLQRCAFLGTTVACLLALIFLGYAMHPGNFSPEDPTGSVIKAMYVLLPCLAAALVCGILSHKLRLDTAQKLIALLKQAPSRTATNSFTASAKKNRTPKVQALLLVVAIALVAYGAARGGTADVLAKAVNLCTECVGLG